VNAQEILHINIGRIVIDNQTASSQKKAGEQAFQQVLVKMSGQPSALQSDVLKRATLNFEQYLTSSSFIQVNGQLVYQASFNQEKMMDLLKFAEMSIWGNRRPNAILWLATETPNTFNKKLITQMEPSPLKELIKTVAYGRGIEINVPIGDLADKTNISIFDVWGLFGSTINAHSKRYATNFTITAKVSLGFDEVSSTEAYIAEWVFIGNGKIESGKSAGLDESEAVEKMLNDYANFLASQYAISAQQFGTVNSIVLTISDVGTLQRFATVVDAINSIALVSNARLIRQKRDTVTFNVTANANEEILANILALDDRFRLSDSLGLVPSAQRLHYQWQGQ